MPICFLIKVRNHVYMGVRRWKIMNKIYFMRKTHFQFLLTMWFYYFFSETHLSLGYDVIVLTD